MLRARAIDSVSKMSAEDSQAYAWGSHAKGNYATPKRTYHGQETPVTDSLQLKGASRKLDREYCGTEGATTSTTRVGVDEPDFTPSDFTKYLEDKITGKCSDEAKAEGKHAVLQEEHVVNFLKKADIKLISFSNKQKRSPKRLVSRKQSIFHNKTTGTRAEYTFRKSAEDSVIAHVKTTKGFSLGVMAGSTGGAPMANAGIQANANYSHTREQSSGSSKTSKNEMEAKATIEPSTKLVAIDSEYHCDNEALCEFEFTVIKGCEIQYKLRRNNGFYDGGKKCINVEEIGFEDCEKDLTAASKKKKVHCFAHFLTTITDVQHELEISNEELEDI